MANFYGRIEGVTVNDIIKKLDYKKRTYEERLEVVEEILKHPFFMEYNDKYNNVVLSTNDDLLSGNNVSKMIEMLGTYLLNSDEEKTLRRKEETKYVFYSHAHIFDRKVARDKNYSDIIKDTTNTEENVIHFLERSKKNYKKVKEQHVTSEDYSKSEELSSILRSYDEFLEVVEELVAGNSAKTKNKRYVLMRTKGQLKQDRIDSKNILLGTFGFNITSTNEGSEILLDGIDFSNENHVALLMGMQRDNNIDTDLHHVLMDFEEVVNEAKNDFTIREHVIYEMFNTGMKRADIAREIGCSRQNVNHCIKNIVKKIVECVE